MYGGFDVLKSRASRQLLSCAWNQATMSILPFRRFYGIASSAGGILAPGASLMKDGENNRGAASRWYPETLARRIAAINTAKNKIEFLHKDAFDVIPKYLGYEAAAFFVDPPYTAGGKSGKRLYLHSSVDHDSLFELLEEAVGEVMPIAMKNTHHNRMYELAITNRLFELPIANESFRLLERSPKYRTKAGK